RSFRAAKPGKVSPPQGLIQVTDGGAKDRPARRPCPASEHAVLPVKVRHGVPFVRKGSKSSVRLKPGGGPLPHVAEHIFAAVRAAAGRVLTHTGGAPAGRVAVAGRGIGLALSPWIGAFLRPFGVPRGRLFPLPFAR